MILLLLALTLALAGPATAQPRTPTAALLFDLLPYQPVEGQLRAYAALERSGDRGAIPALIELLRFDLPVPAELPVGVLEKLSGQRFGPAWPRWVEWLQKQTDIAPPPEFVTWKGRLLNLIDPEFLEWFKPGIPHRIRMEEGGRGHRPYRTSSKPPPRIRSITTLSSWAPKWSVGE